MKVIDGDKLVENLRLIVTCWSISPFVSKEKHSGAVDMLREVAREVKKAPTFTPPNEWVSVKERLPRVGGDFICAVQDKNGGIWIIPAEWNLEMKTWFGAFGEIKNKVTHWMPLPTPPDRRPPEGEEDA